MTSPDAIKAELILLTNDENLAGKLFAKMRNERMVDNTTNIRNIQCILDGKEPEHQHALSSEIDWHDKDTLSAKLDYIAEAVMHSNLAKTLQVDSDTSKTTPAHTCTLSFLCEHRRPILILPQRTSRSWRRCCGLCFGARCFAGIKSMR
jgi:hypothetical protein